MASNGEDIRAWLAAIIRKSGGNLTQLARQAGVSHTTLSRAMDPNQKPPNFRADTIAKLTRISGIPAPSELAAAVHGMHEPDAEPLVEQDGAFGMQLTPDQSLWKVGRSFAAIPGYRPGDHLLVDGGLDPENGDDVLANIYDPDTGTAETVRRTYRKGWLFGGPDTDPELADNRACRVMGVIVRSWRDRPSH